MRAHDEDSEEDSKEESKKRGYEEMSRRGVKPSQRRYGAQISRGSTGANNQTPDLTPANGSLSDYARCGLVDVKILSVIRLVGLVASKASLASPLLAYFPAKLFLSLLNHHVVALG